jgi:hypothetical protein
VEQQGAWRDPAEAAVLLVASACPTRQVFAAMRDRFRQMVIEVAGGRRRTLPSSELALSFECQLCLREISFRLVDHAELVTPRRGDVAYAIVSVEPIVVRIVGEGW